LLVTYQALRPAIADATRRGTFGHPTASPGHASFTVALHAVRGSSSTPQASSSAPPSTSLANGRVVLASLLSPRRTIICHHQVSECLDSQFPVGCGELGAEEVQLAQQGLHGRPLTGGQVLT
jgi:hypothetical protein